MGQEEENTQQIYDTYRPKFPYFKGMLLLSRFSLYKIINFVLLKLIKTVSTPLTCFFIKSNVLEN